MDHQGERPVTATNALAEAAKDQMQRLSIVITALTTLVGPSLAPSANPKRPGTTVIIYDDFHKPGGYTLADYDAKWSILTLGEMAVEDTRQFDNHSLSISATPFRTGKD